MHTCGIHHVVYMHASVCVCVGGGGGGGEGIVVSTGVCSNALLYALCLIYAVQCIVH